MKPSGPGLLCVGSFLITASILSAVIGLFRLPASSSFSFGRLYFLETCPFYLGFKFLDINFIVISYNPLYFCGISCNLSSFLSDCVYFGPLSFFLDDPA